MNKKKRPARRSRSRKRTAGERCSVAIGSAEYAAAHSWIVGVIASEFKEPVSVSAIINAGHAIIKTVDTRDFRRMLRKLRKASLPNDQDQTRRDK